MIQIKEDTLLSLEAAVEVEEDPIIEVVKVVAYLQDSDKVM
jgi:hypothetical protein